MQLCLACHSSKKAYPRWDSPIVGSNDHPNSSLGQQPLVWRKKGRRLRWDSVKMHSSWLDTSPRQYVPPISVMIILMKEALFHKQKPQNKTKNMQQLLPIVRGEKPKRKGVINSRDKIRSAQGVCISTIYCTEVCQPLNTSHRRLDCVKQLRLNGSGSLSCSRSLLKTIFLLQFNQLLQIFTSNLYTIKWYWSLSFYGYRLTN